MKIEQIAADVVQRARAGDQNAMGLIAETRESSLRPEGKQARETLKAILKYCHANPVPLSEPELPEFETPDFGTDSLDALGRLKDVTNQSRQASCAEHDKNCLEAIADCLVDLSIEGDSEAGKVASVILANGPALLDPRLECIKNAFLDDVAQDVFQYTVSGSMNIIPQNILSEFSDVVYIGKTVGRARIIQLVRCTPRAIPLWCRQAAAEVTATFSDDGDDGGDSDQPQEEDSAPQDDEVNTAQDDGGSDDSQAQDDGGDAQDDGQAEEDSGQPQDSGGNGGGGGAAPSGGTPSPSAAPKPKTTIPQAAKGSSAVKKPAVSAIRPPSHVTSPATAHVQPVSRIVTRAVTPRRAPVPVRRPPVQHVAAKGKLHR